jgi:hypothetical protein
VDESAGRGGGAHQCTPVDVTVEGSRGRSGDREEAEDFPTASLVPAFDSPAVEAPRPPGHSYRSRRGLRGRWSAIAGIAGSRNRCRLKVNDTRVRASLPSPPHLLASWRDRPGRTATGTATGTLALRREVGWRGVGRYRVPQRLLSSGGWLAPPI